jgi:hypothetical protein
MTSALSYRTVSQAGDLIKGLNLTGMQDQITVDQGKEPAFLQVRQRSVQRM